MAKIISRSSDAFFRADYPSQFHVGSAQVGRQTLGNGHALGQFVQEPGGDPATQRAWGWRPAAAKRRTCSISSR